jgi:hypothetical protein
MQQTAQHAACNRHHTVCNMPLATCNRQCATRSSADATPVTLHTCMHLAALLHGAVPNGVQCGRLPPGHQRHVAIPNVACCIPNVACCIPTTHVAFQTSHVAFQTSHVAFQTSHVAFQTSHVAIPNVACCIPNVACCIPNVACCTLRVCCVLPGRLHVSCCMVQGYNAAHRLGQLLLLFDAVAEAVIVHSAGTHSPSSRPQLAAARQSLRVILCVCLTHLCLLA